MLSIAAGPACEPAEDAEAHFWVRMRRGWHLVFAGLLLVGIVLAYTDAHASLGVRLGACAVLVGWAAWYVVAAFPAWRRQIPRWGYAYLAGMLPLCLAAVALIPGVSVVLCAAVSHIYFLVPRLRYAFALVVGLFAAFGAILVARGSGVGVFVWLGLSALFSGAFGAWISGIITQSSQRASVITELRATREQLAGVSHERGVLAERERLSRDIHDTLAQGFTSIVMLLEAADAEIGLDDNAVRRHLALARTTARENLAEARSLVATLSPVGLSEASLVEAVRRLVQRFGTELGSVATLTVAGSPRPLAPAAEVVLLRAAQECLANIRKHAAARTVEVCLDYRGDYTGGDGALLRVRDDGRGFCFDPVAVDGFGLHGMRGRAEEVGGCLRVDSAVGHGTTVEVRVP